MIFDGNALDYYIALDDSADDLVIGTGSTIGSNAKISLNSDGVLLVGKTNTTANVVGTEIEGTGTIVSTRASNTNVFLNRTGSDGEIINFRKDNTAIGNIGVSSSDFVFTSSVQDKDIIFKGDDGGAAITALTLDMSAAGAATFNAGITAQAASTITTADNSNTLSLISTDADANSGPILRLARDSGSPAQNDVIGHIQFQGRDAGGNLVDYAEFKGKIETTTDGSEDGDLKISTMNAGTLRDRLSINSNATVFNDDSVDVDFRVESDNNTNAFFVQGSDGFIGMGTNTPETSLHLLRTDLPPIIQLENSSTATDGGDFLGQIMFHGRDGTSGASGDRAFIKAEIGNTSGGCGLKFGTADTSAAVAERMSILPSGKVGIGNIAPAHFITVENNENEYTASFKNNKNPNAAAPFGVRIRFHETPDNGTSKFLECDDTVGGTAVVRAVIFSDGDVFNHDNAYGQLSDQRIKDNITDANSQWDDIKAIKVRNFERKDDIAEYGAGNKVQIGVIAQEVETVSPGLVKEKNPTRSDIEHSSDFGTLYTADDAETKDGEDAVLFTAEDQQVIDGEHSVGDIKKEATHSKKVGDIKTITEQIKGVSYSVLYMKAIKALQEAMTRIETLETKVAALEG